MPQTAGGTESAVTIERRYSMIGTAKLNGLDPEAYLQRGAATHTEPSVHHIEELLPWNHVTSVPPEVAV